MNPGLKKCKGVGIARGHGCGLVQFRRRYGLGLQCGCYQRWLFETDEGKEVLNKSIVRSKKKVQIQNERKYKEQKERLKSIAKLIQEARKPFQQWIRKRDANYLCICCDKDSETWDSGHYYKAELYSGVIFNELNCNKQTVYCNQYLHGNEGEYRKGLIKRYGLKSVEELDKIAIETKNKKWTREELILIKEKYKRKLKEF